MNRRKFGLLAGGNVLAAASFQGAEAQATGISKADPALLTTTLTPLGAERAGNADGSIPAWTGGMQAPPGSPVNINPFMDEQPVVVVNADNIAQHTDLLTEGLQVMITKLGFSVKVYPTHRTASAPQYVYDNTAKNLGTASLDPHGGRYGFINAYGGVPFPIPDMSDPLVTGAQIIWNHLTRWVGFCNTNKFPATYAVSGGQTVLSQGVPAKTRNPYYDPNGTLETFGGYLSLTHAYFAAPAVLQGGEDVLWHTTNTLYHPDIVWSLENGQGRVRKAPNERFDTPSPQTNGVSNADEITGFLGDPEQYDWKFIEKKEMYVPYHNNNLLYIRSEEALLPKTLNPDAIRFEKHRVWVIEATLHPGYRNVLARRRFYIDEDTWGIRLGDCYDANDNLSKVEMVPSRVVPALPGTIDWGFSTLNVQNGDYAMTGQFYYPPLSGPDNFDVIPLSIFDPQEMAARASF